MNRHTNADSLFLRAIRWIFSNTFATCFFFSGLGTIGVFAMSFGEHSVSLENVASGTVFGFSIGLIFSIESISDWTPLRKKCASGIIGMASGAAIAYLSSLGGLLVILFSVAGGGVGLTAKHWIYHANF